MVFSLTPMTWISKIDMMGGGDKCQSFTFHFELYMIAHCVLNTFLKAIFTAGLDSQHNWRKDTPSTLAPTHYQHPLTVVLRLLQLRDVH